MKKTNIASTKVTGVPQGRHLFRLIRGWFSSLIKPQGWCCHEELEKIFAELREVKESVEIIARQIARQLKKRGR
jgi:hypothetical protein